MYSMTTCPLTPIYQSENFFGREYYKERLMNLIIKHKVSILFGESGVGKTSLLHAGLVPYLYNISLFPVFVHFYNEYTENIEEVIIDQLYQTCLEYDINIHNNSEERRLDILLMNSEFTDSKYKSRIKPLFIFDQFELYSDYPDRFIASLYNALHQIEYECSRFLVCIDSMSIHCLHRIVNESPETGLLCLPPFSFFELEDVTEHFFSQCTGKKKAMLENLRWSGSINPTMLMIYMSLPEDKINDISIWDAVLFFYEEKMSILSPRKKRMFEERFLLADGRTSLVWYEDLRHDIGIDVDSILELINCGILKVHNTERYTYCRISNNLLAKIVYANMRRRQNMNILSSFFRMLKH